MTSKRHLFSIFYLFLFLTLFSACKSTKETLPPEKTVQAPQESELNLVFAGDVMAHSVNYKTGTFDKIWRDISPLIKKGDLSFANIEAPVSNDLPWSSYPQFNMHQDYVQAAIKAGFNVFSLANNHTNDQYLDGIKATRKFFESQKEIWSAGLREKSGGEMTFKLIEKNGWKVLFVAVTELLNRPDYASWIDYYPSTEKKRKELKENLKNLRNRHDADLLILSIHTDETEYVQRIEEKRKAFYAELSHECGVDIIWANHPHVARKWEYISRSAPQKNGLSQTFVMYGNGNTISGQRTSPSFTKTETERDYTGDGLIFTLSLKKDGSKKVSFNKTEVSFITTYITPQWQFVVKLLDDDLIHSLKRSDLDSWSDYLQKRKISMEKLK